MHLAQAIGLIQRNDLVAGVVAHATQRFKKANPHGAKVSRLGRIALQHGAVVGYPAGCVKVNAALFGVDAVLAQNQTFAMPAFKQRSQKACVTRRHRVVAAHSGEGFHNVGQHPDWRMHGAHRPEIINKTRVCAAQPVLLGQIIPARLGV